MTLGLLVALENVNKVLSDIQRIFNNTGPDGDPPLENQNFENRASACSKLAQIRPKRKMSCPLDLYGFISIDLTTVVSLIRHECHKNRDGCEIVRKYDVVFEQQIIATHFGG